MKAHVEEPTQGWGSVKHGRLVTNTCTQVVVLWCRIDELKANYMHLSSLGSGVELLKLFTLNKIVELLGF